MPAQSILARLCHSLEVVNPSSFRRIHLLEKMYNCPAVAPIQFIRLLMKILTGGDHNYLAILCILLNKLTRLFVTTCIAPHFTHASSRVSVLGIVALSRQNLYASTITTA